MNLLGDAFGWLLDPANWGGENGIAQALVVQIVFSLSVVLAAAVVAIPLGVLVGHTGKGRELAVIFTGGLRALPTLGVLTLFALWLATDLRAAFLALMILAIPSILAGSYAGVAAVDRSAIDAARAMGMTPLQVVTQVELPLGLSTLMGGVRAAVLQVIATATLAAYIGGGGLGRFLFLGISTRDYAITLGASILIVLLALVFDGIFASLQRLVTPSGVRIARQAR